MDYKIVICCINPLKMKHRLDFFLKDPVRTAQ